MAGLKPWETRKCPKDRKHEGPEWKIACKDMNEWGKSLVEWGDQVVQALHDHHAALGRLCEIIQKHHPGEKCMVEHLAEECRQGDPPPPPWKPGENRG